MDDYTSYTRYLAGDNSGLGELVERHNAGLIRFLMTYVHDPWLAEDLAADSFALLVIRKPSFRGDSSFRTWLYRIGRNQALDELRRQKRRPDTVLDETAGTHVLDESFWSGEERIVEALDRQGELQELRRALAALRPDYQAVLRLIYDGNLSYRETARVMGRTEKQVRNLAYRARAQLKSAVGAGEGRTK